MMEKEHLPKGWELKKLGEVCETTSGGTPSRRESKYYNGNIPWVKSGELNKGIILDTEEKITEEALKNSSAKLFPKGTLLIALYGATIGKLSTLGIEAATNQAVCGIFENNNINSKYLYQFLFYSKPGLIKQSIGGAQPNISQTILKNLHIPLPPLPEQGKIVAKIEELFSELDKGKEQLQTALQQLKVYRQAVLKYAFEGKLTNTNVKDGELPEGWKWVKLGEFAQINPKIPNRELIEDNLEVQFLPMKLVEELTGKIHLTETKTYGEVKKGYTPFINNDVIFAKVTPCMENGKIAVVNNLKNSIGFGSSEFHVVRANSNVLPAYIFNYLIQERFRKEAENEMTGAVGLRRVPKQFLENYSIPLPNIEEQQQIVAEIERRLSVCDKIEETINQALTQTETLRQSILKKAFEGRLVSMEDAVMKQPALSRFTLLQLAACYVEIMGKQKKPVKQGAVGVIKGLYLGDRLEGAKTHVDFANHNYGPFAKAIYDVLDDTRYFKKNRGVYQLNIKYKDLFKGIDKKDVEQLEAAYLGIHEIISKYDYKDRTFKEELLATVCKVVEDIKTTDLKAVRKQMKHWKIDLANFKNKAEKFTEKETADCLKFIINRGWDKKLLSI